MQTARRFFIYKKKNPLSLFVVSNEIGTKKINKNSTVCDESSYEIRALHQQTAGADELFDYACIEKCASSAHEPSF